MNTWLGRLLWAACLASASSACHSTSNPAQAITNSDDAAASVPTAPDGGAACAPGSCNYQTQAGCDAGTMCHPQFDADKNVIPSCQTEGTSGAGDSCTWLGCQRGYICVGDGRCRHMCCGGDWRPCAPNESCTGTIELLPTGSGTPVPAGVGVCVPTDDCDVFDAASCPSGRSCYVIDSRGGVKCLTSGSAEAYEICSATELCQPGLICKSSSNGTGQCRRLCRTGGASPSCPTAEGTVCTHFDNDPSGVGECVFPGD